MIDLSEYTEKMAGMEELPAFFAPALIVGSSALFFAPMIRLNFQGFGKLGGQIAFCAGLDVFLLVYCLVGGFWWTPGQILAGGLPALLWQLIIHISVHRARGSTAALGLLAIPAGHAFLLPAGWTLAWLCGG